MSNADQPAYPVEVYGDGTGIQTGEMSGMATGLSKREMFAMAAMQGLLSNPVYHNPELRHKMVTVPALAETAIVYADELLKQLDKD
jgi:hypothetical protein